MSVGKNALFALAFAVIFFSARYFREAFFSDPRDAEPVANILEREAAALNATLPEMVSEGVRLDKATSGPGNSFNYNYTIVDDDMAEKLVADDAKLEGMRDQLHRRVCAMMPEYRKRGTIVNYSLSNNAGLEIAEISINPEDCSYADIYRGL